MESESEFERHYTVIELARLWHVAPGTLRRWFAHEPGIVRFGASTKLKKGQKRAYCSIRIPATVAERVYRARTNAAL